MQIQKDVFLKKHTTLGIGGEASEFIVIFDEKGLEEAIAHALDKKMDYLVIGGGSNLLISDEKINKVIIKNEITGLERDSAIVRAKSGTVLQDLVDFAIDHGLSGLNKMTGIPGTVGGAIYGNAGAYGQTISDHLIEVTCFDPKTGEMIKLPKNKCNFSYRDSEFKENGLIIIETTFHLFPGNSEELLAESIETLQKRLVKYPKGIKCPGSFFKNIIASELPQETLEKIPKEKIVYGKIPAGSLLEEVGAKGDKLGNIEIAPYHANLFLNKGSGTAADFHTLASKYIRLVHEEFGVILEPEVQLINLPPLF